MVFSVLGRLTLVTLQQLSKASEPTLVIPSSITTARMSFLCLSQGQ